MKTAGFLILCGAIVFITISKVPFTSAQHVHNDIIKVAIDFKPDDDVTTYKQLVTLTNAQDVFHITIGFNVAFYVIQIHTFMKDVQLSTNDQFNHSVVTGSNVGLVQTMDYDVMDYAVMDFYVKNSIVNETALIVLSTYGSADPIPGGCNPNFNIANAVPNQLVTNEEDFIQVDIQEPAVGLHMCEEKAVKLEMYHRYLDDWDLTEAAHFAGLQGLLTIDEIKKHATKVIEPVYGATLRRYYSSYKGIGSVFLVIATHENGASVYVPTISYGCNILLNDGSCEVPYVWYILLPYSLAAGLCLFLFMRYSTYLITYITQIFYGTVVTYYSFSLSSRYRALLFLPIGPLLGVLMTFILNRLRMTIATNTLFMAYFLVSLVFYSPLSDHSYFQYPEAYWGVFIVVVIILSTILNLHPYGLLVASEVLSILLFAIGFSYCLGGTLFYCIINSIRHITTENFILAFIDPPILLRDIFSLIFGFTLQRYFYTLNVDIQESKQEEERREDRREERREDRREERREERIEERREGAPSSTSNELD